MTQRRFGATSDGREVRAFRLAQPGGLTVELLELGATLMSLKVPIDEGLREVALGCDTVADYETQSAALGAVVGRCANRTAHGKLLIDGRVHQLDLNHGAHHLHGGARGFGQQVWRGEPRADARGPSVRFSRRSPAGEGGYPGTLDVHVDYTLAQEARLWIEYGATTDAVTAVNLSNHAYFNLADGGQTDCAGHTLSVQADRYMETDREQIPTGRLLPVDGTPLDLRAPRRLREGLESPHEALVAASGYDHALVFQEPRDLGDPVARAISPDGRLAMSMWTDQPTVQLYTGNFLEGTPARGGGAYGPFAGFALETQGYIDATRHPTLPSMVLRPGETYAHRTAFAFETR